MNDNDIIKALECCVGKSLKRYLCLKCPLRDRDCYGGALLMPAVLELINRQKAEIDKLKLTHALKIGEAQEHYRNQIGRARAEAIREFSEQLNKQAFYVQQTEWEGCVVDCEYINNLVEQMTDGDAQ